MSELLLKFAKQYGNHFKYIVCRWYPLTDKILNTYLGKSSESQIPWAEVSANENIKWSKKFLEQYRKQLN